MVEARGRQLPADGAARCKYSLVPTVAAVRGMALGGVCEFIMHCDRTVAALETYIGLVEVGVGLLPAGGGCKEFAVRAAREVRARRRPAASSTSSRSCARYFQTDRDGDGSPRARSEAKELGYLRDADVVVFNAYELLHVARRRRARWPSPATVRRCRRAASRSPARPGIATLKMMLVNMRDGGFISPYDYEIGLAIARVLCGGEVEPGSLVDEKWLLELERAEFVALAAATPKTQERIAHTLKTGKPLRN